MNVKDFENKLKDLDSLIPITVESKQTVELKPGVWNSETMAGTEYVPINAPDSYKIFRRLYLDFINRRAIFESLYYSAGGIDTQRYLDAVKEIEKNIKLLREHYNYKSVALLIVNANDNPKVQLKLFNDIYLCEYYTKTVLGVTTEQIYSRQMPQHLNGTQIFDQEWYTSMDQLIANYPTPNNVSAERPSRHYSL